MRPSPADLSAVQAAAQVAAGALSAEALTDACLDRIAEREATLRAWAHLDPSLARSEARARDGAPPRSALHGLPLGVKDIVDTADRPTAHGSPLHRGRRPAADAAIVTRLRDAGMVVLGKTVTTEFALFHPGPTTNPWDADRTPGGSSSGSAAAVAAGMVPLALGTQTAGSIVRPASFCGIAGWKPTFGTLPTDGVLVVAPSLDTVGVLAREVADLALFAALVLDTDPVRHVDPQAPVALGFAPTGAWSALEPSTRDRLGALAEAMGLPAVQLPPDFDDLVAAQTALMAHEAALHLGPERERGPVSAELTALLDAGAEVPAEEADRARDAATRCRAVLPRVLADQGVEALLTPAVLGEAPRGLRATGDPLCCRAWTLLGVPCVAVPGLRGPAGLPLGVQVVAPHGEDAVALAAAAQVEQAIAELPR